MMLVMVAHIESYEVQWSIIAVGFVALFEHVVFADEMAGDRMQSHCHQGA